MDLLRPSVCVIAASIAFTYIAGSVAAQNPAPVKPSQRTALPKFITTQKTMAEPSTLRRGASGKLVITLAVEDTFHIYDPNPGDPFLTATKVTPVKVPGVVFGKPIWPLPITVKGAKVHEGTVVVTIPFTIKPSAKPGKSTFGATFYAQGCNATTCYPPATFTVTVPVSIKD